MMTGRLQDMSCLCNKCIINTTHFSSNAWRFYYEKLGFQTGFFNLKKTRINYWIIPTKLGGKIMVLPHLRKNLFLVRGKKGRCILNYEYFLNVIGLLKKRILVIAKKDDVTAVKIVPFICDNKEISIILRKLGFKYDPKSYEMASWHAYIPFVRYNSVSQLVKTFRKTTRYEIKKSLGRSITKTYILSDLSSSNRIHIIRRFFYYYRKFMINFTKHYPLSKTSFDSIISGIEKDPDTDALFTISKLNQPPYDILGVSMFLIYENNLFYFLSAANKAIKKVSSLYSNLYYAISWGLQNGYNGLSLWGVNLDRENIRNWEGFSRFKKGFRPEIAKLIGPRLLIIKPRGWLYLAREYIADLMVRY